MKNKIGSVLVSIKTNNQILDVFKKSKKINITSGTIWFCKNLNTNQISYALLLNKTYFKLAVTRNKIKRQLRNMLINSDLCGGFNVLIKPNTNYLKKEYKENETLIIKTIKKLENGK